LNELLERTATYSKLAMTATDGNKTRAAQALARTLAAEKL
jgi:hypothetical protein